MVVPGHDGENQSCSFDEFLGGCHFLQKSRFLPGLVGVAHE